MRMKPDSLKWHSVTVKEGRVRVTESRLPAEVVESLFMVYGNC